jgi:thymidylate synthase (FAD)
MKRIEVKVLNPKGVCEAEQLMVAAARLTQRGHSIHTMKDFKDLLDMSYSDRLLDTFSELPHPTLQKFGTINVVIVGASRRFLAQITRHQNEVKFMSGSLQYSDFSGSAQFVVPYEIICKDTETNKVNRLQDRYLESCFRSLATYESLAQEVGHDAASYALPQGLRNILLISATPFQWKHMIRQRTCNRNTLETQFVMLLIWEHLYKLSNMFKNCGPSCASRTGCLEGGMCCKRPFKAGSIPTELLQKFEYVWR